MDAEEMKRRTKQFALRVIRLVETLPNTRTADILGRQLLRSGTSVGANYREACRGQSKPDFISKVGIALKEADESLYWMELLIEAELIAEKLLTPLMQECDELIAIMVSTINTARRRR